MYQPMELARFALSEFERGLEALTDEEARTRLKKSDGTEMNAISWTIGHIAHHWLLVAGWATRGASADDPATAYRRTKDDPSPPPLADALKLLKNAKNSIGWINSADDALLSTTREGAHGKENMGAQLLRVVLHTWFHIGEINAVRQQLGHDEIPFVGEMLGHLEWRGGQNGTEKGYRPDELARFAVSEFERGLEGLIDEEALTRIKKSDGTEMNAIAWTVAHIASHWFFVSTIATGERRPPGLRRFGAEGDPTPPSLVEVIELLKESRSRSELWLATADDALLSTTREVGNDPDENVGTRLMRVLLHTWFHIGEINAVRQQLGHDEIPFVGEMLGHLEWR